MTSLCDGGARSTLRPGTPAPGAQVAVHCSPEQRNAGGALPPRVSWVTATASPSLHFFLNREGVSQHCFSWNNFLSIIFMAKLNFKRELRETENLLRIPAPKERLY